MPGIMGQHKSESWVNMDRNLHIINQLVCGVECFFTSRLIVLCSIVLGLPLNPPPVEMETSNEK